MFFNILCSALWTKPPHIQKTSISINQKITSLQFQSVCFICFKIQFSLSFPRLSSLLNSLHTIFGFPSTINNIYNHCIEFFYHFPLQKYVTKPLKIEISKQFQSISEEYPLVFLGKKILIKIRELQNKIYKTVIYNALKNKYIK